MYYFGTKMFEFDVIGYHPIAYYGVVYKCITKILTNRMKRFIPYVVSLN